MNPVRKHAYTLILLHLDASITSERWFVARMKKDGRSLPWPFVEPFGTAPFTGEAGRETGRGSSELEERWTAAGTWSPAGTTPMPDVAAP